MSIHSIDNKQSTPINAKEKSGPQVERVPFDPTKPYQTPLVSKSDTENKAPATNAQDQKKQLNVAILKANQEVNISTKNKPLALLYKTAIESINKELETTEGKNAIEKGYESGLDVSPEATANRILSFSTGLFSLYQKQHPELDQQAQVTSFLDIIGGGIDKGFTEAKDILKGLGVLEGDIASNITKTYDLVQEGLKAFREKLNTEAQSLS